MNDTEKDRILAMVADGTLRPSEAAQLLAALSDEPAPEKAKPADKSQPKQPMVEVQVQRADGTYYTMQVPPHLMPMVWQMAKAAVKEAVRNASQEAWSGFRHIVRTKAEEVKTSVTSRVTGGASKQASRLSAAEQQRFDARQCILQMVQNGRITASDAGRLIQELDAHLAYEQAHAGPAPGR